MMEIKEMTIEDFRKMREDHAALNPGSKLEIREDIKYALDAWAKDALGPGGFLISVLENDLFEAVGRADSYNLSTLQKICGYVYNDLPSECWGSPEKVSVWADSKRNL
ncbi:MAG: hypothetical protein H0X02_08295 [Nitrosomonas sp.]|nr:hypothetical protein [Nitrosomonas sp.]